MKQEWESHKRALDMMKEGKGKHPHQCSRDEREVVYSHIAQNMERMRNVVRNSISRVSTISAKRVKNGFD